MEEFFLFAGLMMFTVILFSIMTYYYKYVEPRGSTDPDDVVKETGTEPDDVALMSDTKAPPVDNGLSITEKSAEGIPNEAFPYAEVGQGEGHRNVNTYL